MSNIMIGFSKPRKPTIISTGMSIWMNRPYSHVYVRFDSNSIPSTVYHASHGMVHFMSWDNFKKQNEVIEEFCFEVSPQVKLDALLYAIDIAGSKYGYMDILKIMGRDICHNLGFEINTSNGNGYICSELAGEVSSRFLGIKYDSPMFLLKPSHIYEKLDVKHLAMND